MAVNTASGTRKLEVPKKKYRVRGTLTVRRARKIAFDIHKAQTDKIGAPYSQHLEAVRAGVELLGGNEEIQIAALFHDTVEDTNYTLAELAGIGVTQRSLDAIAAVTKRPNEAQQDYLDRIIAGGPDAIRVKVADILHNTRHDRIKDLPEYTRTRLLKKYRPALARLLLELELIIEESPNAAVKIDTKPKGTAPAAWQASPKPPKLADAYWDDYTTKPKGTKPVTNKPSPPRMVAHLTVQAAGLELDDWLVAMEGRKGANAPIAEIPQENKSDESVTVVLATGEVLTFKPHESLKVVEWGDWSDLSLDTNLIPRKDREYWTRRLISDPAADPVGAYPEEW